MALNIILICLTAVSALNVLLVYDLYGRTSRLALLANKASGRHADGAHPQHDRL